MPEQTPLHQACAEAGAVFTEEQGWSVPASFGDPAGEYQEARSGAVLFDRSFQGKLEAAGTEAAAFLHNLCTNDIRNLAPGTGCEAFFCTATAKVVAYGLVFRAPPHGKRDSFWLDLADAQLADKLLKHLGHFLISEDVVLTDHSAEFCQLSLAGPQSAAVLGRASGTVPDLRPLQHHLVSVAGAECFLRRHDLLGVPGYDLRCPRDRAAAVWQALREAKARLAGTEAFETLRVEAGSPRYGVDVDDSTFAPEVGRTASAISYNKGCYLGQEPVVMARDRGQVNRTLLGLRLTGEGPVPHNSKLYREGKEVGRVTSGVYSPLVGAAIALAYVRRGSQAPGTSVEVEADGQRRPAQVAGLPFGEGR
jgi:folate-binding protein YgfZ